MSNQTKRNITLNLWTARIIPVVLIGVVGYATYVLVALLAGELGLFSYDIAS